MRNEAPEPVVDTRKYFRESPMWDLPPIDIADPEAVRERGCWYIRYCSENDLRPGVAGLCLAWGISRRTFSGWASGAHRSQTHQKIAVQFKLLLLSLMESYAMDGKISPIATIFFLKNHFGYEDQFNLELIQGRPVGEARISPEELAEKYSVQ